MTTKSREYTRELSPKDLQNLKERYKNHIKPIRKGFLNADEKKLLLQISRWDPHTQDRVVYDFFYDIRERAKSALLDLQLICDILNEEQLHLIFGTRQKSSIKNMYPITEVLTSLLPSTISMEDTQRFVDDMENRIAAAKIDLENNRDRPEEVKRLTDWINANEARIPIMKRDLPRQEEKMKEQEWRKFILEDVALKVLQWYLYSGLFKTDSHKRMIIDVMDAITIMSSGKKKYFRRDPEQTGINVFPY